MSAVDLIAVTATTLDEVARAISELSWEHEFYGAFVVSPEEELKVLSNLFRQRSALSGNHANDDLCNLAATLILGGMVAQNLCDLKLAAQSRSPFSNSP